MRGETHQCKPTLTDEDVVQFCKQGFVVLEAVVPDEVNRRTTAFLDEHPGMEPNEILGETWFFDAVIKNPAATGVLRSLLGAGFLLPTILSNHRIECPRQINCGWHRDSGSIFTPRLDFLQVFYYPQDTPQALGPTELLPSSHFIRGRRRFMEHYGNIRYGVWTAAPAGSIFITHYSIWHRATAATASGVRNLLKYNYWRTALPGRDWIADGNVDAMELNFLPGDVPGNPMLEKWHQCIPVARMFYWLCGLGEELAFTGGLSWPINAGYGRPTDTGLPSAFECAGESPSGLWDVRHPGGRE
jgi:hypothetical protein